MTVVEFVERHPEFRNAGALIGPTIADAKKRLNSVVLGDVYESAIALLTCDLLARTPYGQTLRLVDDKGETTYSLALARLKRERAPRMVVL